MRRTPPYPTTNLTVRPNPKTTSQASTADQVSGADNISPPQDRANIDMADDEDEEYFPKKRIQPHPSLKRILSQVWPTFPHLTTNLIVSLNLKTTSQASTADQVSGANAMPPPQDRADPDLTGDDSEDIASTVSQKRRPVRRSVSINTLISRVSKSEIETERGGHSGAPISQSSSFVRFSVLLAPIK